jgi:predicted enzyme related to lactoylglutathione lyase
MDYVSKNGKICYLEIPAADVVRSADFYQKVFGWDVRERGNGELSFDDGVEVSGMWVLGRPPAGADGIRISIMVDEIAATLDAVVAHGGSIFTAVGEHPTEMTARFKDPYGNILSLYQEPA